MVVYALGTGLEDEHVFVADGFAFVRWVGRGVPMVIAVSLFEVLRTRILAGSRPSLRLEGTEGTNRSVTRFARSG